MDTKIATYLIKEIYEVWVKEYGPTYPLYGTDTKRSDISGSIRPLLSSTEISHIKVLSSITGISKKKLDNIFQGITKEIDFETADILVSAMGQEWRWHWPLEGEGDCLYNYYGHGKF